MFDHFISLGSWCPTAGSMAKYGLRSWSGPFDWLASPDFGKVLQLIENGFCDFLCRDHLEKFPDDPKRFKDVRYEIDFFHEQEFSSLSDEDYEGLRRKYDRKIRRFKEEIKKKSCFLRSVVYEEEAEYIGGHEDYIKQVLYKENKESEVVFLIKKGLPIPSQTSFRFYQMQGIHSGLDKQTLRSWFDGADEFLTYCGKNFSVSTMMKNIAFDRKKEESESERLETDASRYHLLVRLLNYDFGDLPECGDLIVYGAGNIGRCFYRKIKDKCAVRCFVDREKAGSTVDGLPVIWLDGLGDDSQVSFVVTAVYDFERIRMAIRGYFPDSRIISLEDLMDMQQERGI